MRAAAVAALSGVSPDLQREWRRRGFLPKLSGGHARFSVREAAHLLIMRSAADVGAMLPDAKRIADQLAAVVVEDMCREYDGPLWAVVQDGTARLTAYPLIDATPARLLISIRALADELAAKCEALLAESRERA